MKSIILPSGIFGEELDFSLENLKNIIHEKCESPVKIKLEFWDLDGNVGTMAISMLKDLEEKIGSSDMIYVFIFDLQNEDFKDYLWQCYLVKKFLKRTYPEVIVSSNFR